MFNRSLPSPAMVIASLALFLALGGTGYAATQLRSGGGQASASKVKIKRGPRGKPGPQGPQGERGAGGPAAPRGPQGRQGPQGGEASAQAALARANEAMDLKLQSALPSVVTERTASGQVTLVAECPAGSVLAGGGFAIPSGLPVIKESAPEGNQWSVEAFTTGAQYTIKAFATCLSRSP